MDRKALLYTDLKNEQIISQLSDFFEITDFGDNPYEAMMQLMDASDEVKNSLCYLLDSGKARDFSLPIPEATVVFYLRDGVNVIDPNILSSKWGNYISISKSTPQAIGNVLRNILVQARRTSIRNYLEKGSSIFCDKVFTQSKIGEKIDRICFLAEMKNPALLKRAVDIRHILSSLFSHTFSMKGPSSRTHKVDFQAGVDSGKMVIKVQAPSDAIQITQLKGLLLKTLFLSNAWSLSDYFLVNIHPESELLEFIAIIHFDASVGAKSMIINHVDNEIYMQQLKFEMDKNAEDFTFVHIDKLENPEEEIMNLIEGSSEKPQKKVIGFKNVQREKKEAMSTSTDNPKTKAQIEELNVKVANLEKALEMKNSQLEEMHDTMEEKGLLKTDALTNIKKRQMTNLLDNLDNKDKIIESTEADKQALTSRVAQLSSDLREKTNVIKTLEHKLSIFEKNEKDSLLKSQFDKQNKLIETMKKKDREQMTQINELATKIKELQAVLKKQGS